MSINFGSIPNLRRIGSWKVSILSSTVYSEMYKDRRDCSKLFFEFGNGMMTYYQTDEAFEKLLNFISKKANKNPSYIYNWLDSIEKQLSKDSKELDFINKKLELKNSDLVKLFSRYWKSYQQTVFGIGIDLYFDNVLSEKLEQMIREKAGANMSLGDFNYYYSILSSAQKITTTQKEEIDFLNMFLSNFDGEKIKKKMERHLEKYSFLPMWSDSLPWTMEDLIIRKNNLGSQLSVRKRQDMLLKEIEFRKTESKKIIKKLKFSKEENLLIKNMQRFSYLRQQGEIQMSWHNYQGKNLKEKIAEKLGTTYDSLAFMADKEIIASLKGKIKITQKEIEKRKNSCFLIIDHGKYTLFSGQRAKKEIEKIKSLLTKEKEKFSNKKKNLIKGMVGSMGRVTGKVKNIRNDFDVKKVKKGDIIVVSGTSVDNLIAIHKAAAIISEFGGITGHAAVICREMKKPCITKVERAINLFKDGEIIEVDAEAGIIKRIN